jgi:hypothetical protein
MRIMQRCSNYSYFLNAMSVCLTHDSGLPVCTSAAASHYCLRIPMRSTYSLTLLTVRTACMFSSCSFLEYVRWEAKRQQL